MWSHTRSLELLVLAASIAPAELVRVAGSFGSFGGGAAAMAADGSARTRRERAALIGVPAAYAGVCALAVGAVLAGGFTPGYLKNWPVAWWWLVAAAAAGCAAIMVEFGIAAAPSIARGVRGLRFGVMTGTSAAGHGYLLSITVTAVAEEILYRGVWVGTLRGPLAVPAVAAIALAAVAYALGHLFFGWSVVGQKAVTGFVYGTLLVVSGSLLVPVVAHVAQNAAVLGLQARQS
jgi:membrane protease YdiL (CAAX protease family)